MLCIDGTQRNGAVSKVNEKCIYHLTGAQRTLSAAETIQVSHALITVLRCVHPGSHHTHTHTHTHKESLFLLRRHLGNWPRGPAVSMRSELLVEHEKLGQFLLLTVYVVPL